MRGNLLRFGEGIVFLVVLMAVGLLAGCDRSEPPPAQTSSPAATQPPAQPQTAVPVQSAPPAQAPMQPQQAMPSPAVTQPTPAPAQTQGAGQQDFGQVQMGMTSQQVQQLLGSPTKIKQKHQEVEWEYYTSQGKFEIEFQMDKVVKIERH